MVNTALLYAGIVLVLILIWVGLAARSLMKLPRNDPKRFLSRRSTSKPDKPVVVFAGDSITHGTFNPDWTRIVEDELRDSFEIINAGVNGNTTSDLLARLDDIIACQPSAVILLIGNNNAMGTFARNRGRYSRSQQQGRFSEEVFFTDLREIIQRFQENGIKLGVFSLVPYTEIPTSEEFRCTKLYSDIVKQVAEEMNVIYLPLFETLEDLITKEGISGSSPLAKDDLKLMLMGALVKKGLLRQSWDAIAKKHHLKFTVDTIHISPRTARIMAQMAIGFLSEEFG